VLKEVTGVWLHYRICNLKSPSFQGSAQDAGWGFIGIDKGLLHAVGHSSDLFSGEKKICTEHKNIYNICTIKIRMERIVSTMILDAGCSLC
jgi:hypothetical protein